MDIDLATVMARWQFAVTTVYHFIFVPITIGLAPILAVMHTMYYFTNNDKYRRMTVFFGKLFLINFALGLVTGITQEFQFGMNWSGYSDFVGDIFGAPLAMEALLAFFLESTFLGLWMFGWKRLPAKLHLMSIWLVAAGTWFSALFILSANSFMQNPVGFIYNPERNRLELDNFLDVLTNPVVPFMFGHVITGSLATAGCIVIGVSAMHLLKKNQVSLFRSALSIGLVFTFAASVSTSLIGHGQAQQMAERMPMKLAAAEAQWESYDSNAPFSLFTIGDMENRRNNIEIGIPGFLSYLATNETTGAVKGMNELQEEYEAEFGPGNYIPNTMITYWTFRLMAGVGILMLALSFSGLIMQWRKQFSDGLDGAFTRLWLKVAVPCLTLGVFGTAFGWIFTEVGRQPWLVHKWMLTKDGISVAVPAWQVIFTFVVFTLVYGALAVAEFYLMIKYAKDGPEAPTSLPGHQDGELLEEHDLKPGTFAEANPVAPVVNY